MHILMNYVDLGGYVSMLRVSKKLNEDMTNQFGIQHLLTQYTQLLLHQQPRTEADIQMLRHYATALGTQLIPIDVDVPLHPFFDVPNHGKIKIEQKWVGTRTRIKRRYEMLPNFQREVPAVLIFSENNTEVPSLYVERMVQWTCESIGMNEFMEHDSIFLRETYVEFVQKTDEEKTNKNVSFSYRNDNRLVNYVQFNDKCDKKRYCFETISSGKGYYQEKYFPGGKIMIFYYPFKKCQLL